MVKLIVILIIIVAASTAFLVKRSKEKKWKMITVSSTLIVELILRLYRDESEFIHKITSIEFVLILLVLWILAIAPHVDNAIEKHEKDNESKEKAGISQVFFL